MNTLRVCENMKAAITADKTWKPFIDCKSKNIWLPRIWLGTSQCALSSRNTNIFPLYKEQEHSSLKTKIEPKLLLVGKQGMRQTAKCSHCSGCFEEYQEPYEQTQCMKYEPQCITMPKRVHGYSLWTSGFCVNKQTAKFFPLRTPKIGICLSRRELDC